MEGAARSGYLAAREIQKSAGVPQSQLVADLPAEGLMSILS
jgi:hypothetical protein